MVQRIALSLSLVLALLPASAGWAQASLPPGGTFVDDDGNVHEGYIEAVAAAGITRGCNSSGDRYCPGDPVSRGQMAAFLVRALSLPPSAADRFLDDQGSVFEADINALAAAGITQGCQPDRYCPGDPVSRGQMAAFLVRALHLPPSAADRFLDDQGSVFEADINALAAAGITKGCRADRFCPHQWVAREQMASFLGRALGLTALVPPPRPVVEDLGPAQVISQGEGVGKVVSLTFDAGSDRGYAAEILDTLEAYGIEGSFGITGRWAEANPDLLVRMVAEGHHLINHSYDHPPFTDLSTEERSEQLDRTEQIVFDLTGVSTKPYFRPPYMAYDASVNADVGARGYRYNLLWTVDSWGWMGISRQEIIDRCLARAEPGAIYLFHVGSQSQDGPALAALIEGLQAQGYGFVSADRMIGD